MPKPNGSNARDVSKEWWNARDGPEFIRLCDQCERDVRWRAGVKVGMKSEDAHATAGLITVPIASSAPLILEAADIELEETYGIAFLDAAEE